MSQENKLLIGIISFGIICIVATVGFAKYHQETVYKELQVNIKNENWSRAKSNIEELGIYKDSKELSKNVDYNYYIFVGDNQLKNNSYREALANYKKSLEINSDDNELKNKITNVENIITKQEQITKQKQLEKERIAKLEQEKAARQKIAERRKQLADITPAIKRTFYKIEFLEDKSLNARIYDFYVEPSLWYQFNYDVKESAFKLAVLYAKLKTNEQYSNDDYLFSTKIRNATDKSILAEYTAFSGIKTK